MSSASLIVRSAGWSNFHRSKRKRRVRTGWRRWRIWHWSRPCGRSPQAFERSLRSMTSKVSLTPKSLKRWVSIAARPRASWLALGGSCEVGWSIFNEDSDHESRNSFGRPGRRKIEGGENDQIEAQLEI